MAKYKIGDTFLFKKHRAFYVISEVIEWDDGYVRYVIDPIKGQSRFDADNYYSEHQIDKHMIKSDAAKVLYGR